MVQQKGENTTFSRVLPYAAITVAVLILCGRLDEPEYQPYFFRILVSATILTLLGGLSGFLMAGFMSFDLPGGCFPLGRLLRILGYTAGAVWAAYHWEMILLYLEGIQTGCPDPVLGKDIAFYLFELPFYESVFGILFYSVAVNLAWQFVRLFVQGDKDYHYNRIYIHIGLLLFVLAWGRYLERCDQLYWQLGLSFDSDCACGAVVLPSAGQSIAAAITGSFFVLFPFVRHRLPIISALAKLSANRPGNPHFRLIRYVLSIAMIVMWQTGLQIRQLPVDQVAAAGLHAPFCEAGRTELEEYKECYTNVPLSSNEFESEPGQDKPGAFP